MDSDFTSALRVRGVDVRTAGDDGMCGRLDLDQLRWATAQGRVLYSFNVGDFYALHTKFLTDGEPHAGIILAQQRYSVGDQLRGVLKLIATQSAVDMLNQIVFLSVWI
jgi:hypothetical protein